MPNKSEPDLELIINKLFRSGSIFNLVISLIISIIISITTNLIQEATGIPIFSVITLALLGVCLFGLIVLVRKTPSKTKIKLTYPNLSVVGIMRLRNESQSNLALLIISSLMLIYTFLPYVFNVTLEWEVVLIAGVVLLLILVNKTLLNYRVGAGFYGGSEREAREIIQFIRDESSNIDFKDGGGSKQIISEQDLQEIRQEVARLIPQGLPAR